MHSSTKPGETILSRLIVFILAESVSTTFIDLASRRVSTLPLSVLMVDSVSAFVSVTPLAMPGLLVLATTFSVSRTFGGLEEIQEM